MTMENNIQIEKGNTLYGKDNYKILGITKGKAYPVIAVHKSVLNVIEDGGLTQMFSTNPNDAHYYKNYLTTEQL